MGDVPVLKPREVIKILEHLGFKEVRQRGSHKQFSHGDGRFTTVPVSSRQRRFAKFVTEDCRRHQIDGRRIFAK